MRRLAEQHAKTPVTGSVTATATNAKDAGRALATGVQKMFKINVLQIDLRERATGLEPATSSLGSMPVFTDYCVTRQAFGTYRPPLAPRTVKIWRRGRHQQ